MVIKFRASSLYDTLIWILLVWCVLQDFLLSLFFKITSSVFIVKLLFYSKDVLVLVLTVSAFVRLKAAKKQWLCFLFYFMVVAVLFCVSFLGNKELGLVSLLSSTRGVVLMPSLIVIGLSVKNKDKFFGCIPRYYKFLIIIAILGFIEFIADFIWGTKGFWIEFCGLENYYVKIKGQSGALENGTPGNWYTDIGKGYRTQKRFISVWAAPLTAAFVMLLPGMYSMIHFFRNRKLFLIQNIRRYRTDLLSFLICFFAISLTFTRQVILPYLAVCIFVFIYNNRRYKNIIYTAGGIIVVLFCSIFFKKIFSYIYNGSTKVHILRIMESLEQVQLWGNGVGTFGTRFGGMIATESQYITVLGQLGVIGLVLYIIILCYPIWYCYKRIDYLSAEKKIIVWSLIFSGITVVLAGMVSETVVAFTSSAQYYIFIGMSWGYCDSQRKEKWVQKL